MFGRKAQVVKAEENIVKVLARPNPVVPMCGTTPLGAYDELAQELGFRPAQLLEEQLLRFLAEQKIPVYNHMEVDEYLTRVAVEADKIWIWRPLRERDKPKGWQWNGHYHNGNPNSFGGHGSYRDAWEYRPYNKAVPIHILRQVKTIQDRFSEAVLFFVSDYAVPQPDPFIMVTALDVAKIVFGVWDEPGFGE